MATQSDVRKFRSLVEQWERIRNEPASADPSNLEAILETQATIARYERLYGLSSREMEHRIDIGELEETTELCGWLMEVRMLEHLLANRH